MTETITRQPRSLEKREVEARAKAWAPPTLLPEPEPEAGFAFRWIRISTLNAADPTNVSSKLREGWTPVKADSQPQMGFYAAPEGRFAGCIEVGGLLLCKIPAEFMEQRDAYYQGQAASQMQSVDSNFMRESDARMPLFTERKSKVKFGQGT
jgi:hypothetical protein